MGSSLGDLLPYAVPVALSPLPIIAVLMLLLAPAGIRGGLAFLAGRIMALAALALVLAAVAAWIAPPGSGGEGGGLLRIAAGIAVIGLGAVTWHRRPRGAVPAEPPAWMRSIERATPARALGLGLLLTVANVKELAFAAGAGMIIGGAALPPGRALALATVFALLGSLGVAAPVLWMRWAGGDGRDRLAAARDWLVRNNAGVMAAVLVVIGAMLIGSGIETL